jgi:hypothetical protein
MTKYILNSGGLRNNPAKAKKFFTEIVKGLGNKPKLLVCCFAQPREDWETKFAQDKEDIIKLVSRGVSPILELAIPSAFEKQIKNSDTIYIHGGDDHLIRYWFEKFDIPDIWKGKVVATNSASSHVLSKHFWTCDWRELMDGLGILPIKFLAHYKSAYGNNDPRGPINWTEAYKKLKNYGNKSLPIYALKEGEYTVVEK